MREEKDVSEISLYTIMVEFRGGTFLSQVAEVSPQRALTKWGAEVAGELDLTDAELYGLRCELVDEELVAVDGLRAVWCASPLIADELALINMVRTYV